MNIDRETVQEIASQLTALYGHAVSDIMPIILHTISGFYLIKVLCILGGLSIIAVLSIPLIRYARSDEPCAEKMFVMFFAYMMASIFAIGGLLRISQMIAFIIYPEAYIILPLLS